MKLTRRGLFKRLGGAVAGLAVLPFVPAASKAAHTSKPLDDLLMAQAEKLANPPIIMRPGDVVMSPQTSIPADFIRAYERDVHAAFERHASFLRRKA